MIGQFVFQGTPGGDAICLQLMWSGNERQGVLHVPPDIEASLLEKEYPVANGDQMMLGIALGHGVTLAALSQCPLRVCGDASAWPEEWGPLSWPH